VEGLPGIAVDFRPVAAPDEVDGFAMLKFLHAADIHLDSPLRGLESYEGAPADSIRGATRRAFENLVGLAINERVAFVLLAGDLYDGDWQDYNTGLYLVGQMGRLREAGIKVFVIAGNHDAQSKMTRRLRLPDNVSVLSTESPQSIVLDDLGMAIHGQGFPTPAVKEDLSQQYPLAIRGLFNIGLLHTSAGGAAGHERYAPCNVQGLSAKGYNYWALGHVHCRETLCHEPFIAFPGNTQGRHIRETGEKGCLLVTVDDGLGARAAFRRLDVVRWEPCEIAADWAEREDDLLAAVSARFSHWLGEEDPDRLLAVRVEFQGASRLHEALLANPARLAAEVRARAADLGAERIWVEQVKIRTQPMHVASDASEGPFEEVFAILDEMRADEATLTSATKLFADLRQKLPLEFFQVPDALAFDDRAWLLEMVDAAEALLRARFQSG
jgi:DNA repair exonuclease SbcCD nuclease subunit